MLTNGNTPIYVEGNDGVSTCLNGGTLSLNFRLRSTTTLYANNSLVLTKQ